MMTQKFGFDRYLNIRSAHAPAWFDDDRGIAFLMDVTGTPQVWSVDAAGGWPDQLTFFEEKVWTLDVGPDGKNLVCTRDIGGNERYQLFLASCDGAVVRRISQDPQAIHHFGAWDRQGKKVSYTSNERDGVHFDVYVQDLDDLVSRLVFQTEGNFRVLAWSPDGGKLILDNEISSSHTPLYYLDLDSGQARPLTPPDEPAMNLQARWVEDDHIYYLTNSGGEFLTLARLQIDTGEVSYLVEDPPGDVEWLAAAPTGKALTYIVNVDGYSQLFLYDLARSETKRITGLPDGVFTEPIFSSAGDRLAVSVQSPAENLNVWIVNLDDEPVAHRKLTHSSLAGIPPQSFVVPELISYTTFDGRSIPGFFYKPRNVQSPPACILYVHGGPASQILPDFDPRFQFFLQQGYAILAPNVRGSSGYGKSYLSLDDVELRMDSVADLKYAVDWLKDSGQVDPGRIAIYGRSYGGFMVLSAITTYPDLWAAAIDVAGIANWVTFLENTGAWRRAHREKEYGSLKDDRDFLRSISPIHGVDKIQCPLLVIHGTNDPRVPVTEADQIVSSLRERDHPVEYLRYEDEGHKIAKLSNRIDSFTKMADFLARYLQ